MATFRERLRRERTAAGLSQQQLGELVGVDQSVIARLERGQRPPSIEMARKLGRALGILPSCLVDIDRGFL